MYIVFVFTKVVTAITLRMMKSVIQSGYKTFHCFLSITFSFERATDTQHTTTVINTDQGHSTVGEGHFVRSERCRLRWQGFLPPCFGDLAVFMLLFVALTISLSATAWKNFFHVGFPLLVSLAVEGISWYEKFLELLRQFKITQAEYSPTSLSVH